MVATTPIQNMVATNPSAINVRTSTITCFTFHFFFIPILKLCNIYKTSNAIPNAISTRARTMDVIVNAEMYFSIFLFIIFFLLNDFINFFNHSYILNFTIFSRDFRELFLVNSPQLHSDISQQSSHRDILLVCNLTFTLCLY